MKFWQLNSIMRSEPAVLEAILIKPEWDRYYEWYLNDSEIVAAQDREKLDAIMPNDLVRDVLKDSKQKLFLDGDTLRSYKFGDNDVQISVLSAVERFGGEIVEDVFEKGSFKVG